jgi:hypothetical protein
VPPAIPQQTTAEAIHLLVAALSGTRNTHIADSAWWCSPVPSGPRTRRTLADPATAHVRIVRRVAGGPAHAAP